MYQVLFSTYERIRIQRGAARSPRPPVGRVGHSRSSWVKTRCSFCSTPSGTSPRPSPRNTRRSPSTTRPSRRFQHSKGTILPYNNITISEGQRLPNCVPDPGGSTTTTPREAAIELRQRPGAILPNQTDPAGVPIITGPVSLPSLLEGSPKLRCPNSTPVDPEQAAALGDVNPADPLGKYAMPAPSMTSARAAS